MKRAIAHYEHGELGYRPENDEIVCTVGVKQAISDAMLASLNAGDEVLIPAPCWTSYMSIVAMAGGKVVPVQTDPADDFVLRAELLERHIGPRTRWIFLNSPSNPTGAMLSQSNLQSLAELLRRHPGIRILCDDIYHRLILDERPFLRLSALATDLRNRILTVNGVSKTYAMTGLRIGWAIGDVDLIKAMTIVQSQTSSCPNSVGQAAAIEALGGCQDGVSRARAFYRRRRDILLERLSEVPDLKLLRPAGGFFAWVGCYDLIGRCDKEGKVLQNDIDVASHFLAHGVAVYPDRPFRAKVICAFPSPQARSVWRKEADASPEPSKHCKALRRHLPTSCRPFPLQGCTDPFTARSRRYPVVGLLLTRFRSSACERRGPSRYPRRARQSARSSSDAAV